MVYVVGARVVVFDCGKVIHQHMLWLACGVCSVSNVGPVFASDGMNHFKY